MLKRGAPNKLNIHQNKTIRTLGLGLTAFFAVFSVAYIFIPYMAWDAANAEAVALQVQLDQLKIRLNTGYGDTDGDVKFGIVDKDSDGELSYEGVVGENGGTIVMSRKQIEVDTNASYFTLYLSMKTDSQELCRNGNCVEGQTIGPVNQKVLTGTQLTETNASEVESTCSNLTATVYDTWGINASNIFGSLTQRAKTSKYYASCNNGWQWGYAVVDNYGTSKTREAVFTVDGAKKQTVFSSPCYYYLGEAVDSSDSLDGSETYTYGRTASFQYAGDSACENGGSEDGSSVAYATWLAVPKSSSEAHPIWTAYAPTYDGNTLSKGYASSSLDSNAVVCNANNKTTCNSAGPKIVNVIYGALIDDNVPAGQFYNSVVYTVVASLHDDSQGGLKNAYLESSLGGSDDEVEVMLNITALSDFSTDDVRVFMIAHNEFTDLFSYQAFSGTNGGSTYAWKYKGTIAGGSGTTSLLDALIARGAECTVTSVPSSSVSSSSDGTVSATTGGNIVFTAPTVGTNLGNGTAITVGSTLIPARSAVVQESNGNVDVTYDFVIVFTGYEQYFSTRNGETGGLSYRYVGLQSKNAKGEYYVTKMQQMTTGICNMTTGFNIGRWQNSNGSYNNVWPAGSVDGLKVASAGTYYQDASGNYLKANGDPITNENEKVELPVYGIDEDGVADAFYGVYTAGTGYVRTAVYSSNTSTDAWATAVKNNHRWTLTDVRDGKRYVVSKLADGNCWMVQNLDLDLQDNITLTEYDTDLNVSYDTVGKAYTDSGAIKWTPVVSDSWIAEHPTNDASRGTSIVTQYESESSERWSWDYNTYAHAFDQTNEDKIPVRYTDDGTSESYCTNDIEITNGQMLFSTSTMLSQTSCSPDSQNAGNWYSWATATAGGTLSSGNEYNSICPKGWQLSTNTADDTRSYYYLIRTAYNDSSNGDSKIRLLPMSFIRSGRYYYNGSLSSRGSEGYYWSSAANNSNYAYILNFYSRYLNPQNGNYKGYGFSVRCVAR